MSDTATTTTLLDRLDAGELLVGDGAMGTALQGMGLEPGGAGEVWNVERPEVIEEVLESYAQAGAHLLTTNTFGGSKARLALHGLGERVHEINLAGARVARNVADRHPGTLVLGDLGPLGELLEPMGTLTPDEARALFAEQATALAEGGVDGFVIETLSDLAEVTAAVEACREVAPALPVIVTMSFDTNLRTMMGVKPAVAVTTVAGLGVRVIGANCGRGSDEMRVIAAEMAEVRPEGVHLITQTNAGLPKLVDGEFVFTESPEVLGAWAAEMRAMGIAIVGGCCGSTPEHVKAIAAAS